MKETLITYETSVLAREIGFEPIKNHSNYWINNEGRILNKNLKQMKSEISNRGYERIMLSDTRKKYSIHRLVAIQFIPNIKALPEINHKDGNKLNNHVDNLEWSTHSENGKHSYKFLGRIKYWKGIKGKNNPLSKKILCIETGEIFDNSRIAEEKTKINDSSIVRCCQGKRISAGGYGWKYFNKNLLTDLAITKGFICNNEDCSQLIYMILLQKWLREEHNINVISYPSAVFNKKYIYLLLSDLELIEEGDIKYDSYEQALEAGLYKALLLI